MQPCCGEAMCDMGLGCVGGTCVPLPCGGAGQICCKAASSCDANLMCVAGTCEPCGSAPEPCCPGKTCASGQTCTADFCVPAVPAPDAGVHDGGGGGSK
jgi:hypothetical protein